MKRLAILVSVGLCLAAPAFAADGTVTILRGSSAPPEPAPAAISAPPPDQAVGQAPDPSYWPLYYSGIRRQHSRTPRTHFTQHFTHQFRAMGAESGRKR
jgi:hypothetical protein